MLDIFSRPASRKDLFGRFGAHHQDAANAIGRIFVIDGTVAIGPVDVLEPTVPGDRDQGVFLPGGAATRHDLVDLRPDDVPDFRPYLARGPANGTGMPFGAYRAPIGVVVEAQQVRPPPDVHRVPGVEQQADRGA